MTKKNEEMEKKATPTTDYEKQIAELKKELARAKGEHKRLASPAEKKVIPSEPEKTALKAKTSLDKENGFMLVDVMIGENIKYRSFPKDDGKGIARTITFLKNKEGKFEQKHEYNNIGITNVVTAEAKLLTAPAEVDGVIYFALKARKEAIKAITPDQFAEAVTIRNERKEAKKEEREQIKKAKMAEKEQKIADLEKQLAELEKKATK